MKHWIVALVVVLASTLVGGRLHATEVVGSRVAVGHPQLVARVVGIARDRPGSVSGSATVTIEDAEKLAEELEGLRFQTRRSSDPSLDDWNQFERSEWSQGIGHRSRVLAILSGTFAVHDGENYLLPRDFGHGRVPGADWQRQAISLSRAVGMLARGRPEQLLVVVDGCRTTVGAGQSAREGNPTAGVEPRQEFPVLGNGTAVFLVYSDQPACNASAEAARRDRGALLRAVVDEAKVARDDLHRLYELLVARCPRGGGVQCSTRIGSAGEQVLRWVPAPEVGLGPTLSVDDTISQKVRVQDPPRVDGGNNLDIVGTTKPEAGGPARIGSGDDSSRRTGTSGTSRPSPATGKDCDATVDTTVDDQGVAGLVVRSACRANADYEVHYGAYRFAFRLDQQGEGRARVDLFLGRSALRLVFADGKTIEPEVRGAGRLRHLAKAAIVWRGDIDLDLHAHEYGAGLGRPGHYYQDRPGGADAARQTRGGWMTTVDPGIGDDDHAEVYTVELDRRQRQGTVQFAVDYRSRGDRPSGRWCGGGEAASVGFDRVLLLPGERPRVESVEFGRVACGTNLQERARYSPKVAPGEIHLGR